jgi:hypothetical protein
MDSAQALARLVTQLQLAYSGELAAAYAYRGHWRSLPRGRERDDVRKIEDDEWHHRRLVGGILAQLGSRPRRAREIRAWLIGRTLGLLCHVSGWFLPMYGAGRLERRNIVEYEDAAAYAIAGGRSDLLECLLTMAEVEWDHELFFRSKVEGHPWSRLFRVWSRPPARESIRLRYGGLQRG